MAKMGFEKDKRFARDFNNRRETVRIGDKVYNFRSQLEKNVAMDYLVLLKACGQIKDWNYEFMKFEFPDDSYLVDFTITENDGSFYHIEAKGMWDARAKRKLALLNKYYPQARIVLVFGGKHDAAKVARKYRSMCERVCIFRGIRGLEDYQGKV